MKRLAKLYLCRQYINQALYDEELMTGEHFGDYWIIRPGIEAEAVLRSASEAHLRSKFLPGVYEDPQVVNEIAQHQFSFFAGVLSDLLPRVASRDFMSFVLNQYDDATKIEALSKRGELTRAEDALWDEIGPTFRRTAKYLAERISMLTPPADPIAQRAALDILADQIWSAAEQMVDYAMMSEAIHSVFPDQSVTIIHEPGHRNYLDQRFKGVEFDEEFRRMRRDLGSRERFLPGADSIFHDIERQNRFLGVATAETIGVSYQAALRILAATIDGSLPPPDGFPVPFVHLETAVQGVAGAFKLERGLVRRILAGFTLRVEDMWEEGREIWKPKQEYRALRRGFFEFPHITGMHLTFAREMAKESLAALMRGVVFGRFPKEWRSPAVNAALSRLGNDAGHWFEMRVRENVDHLGFQSVINAKQAIGTGSRRLRIPPNVGELDYLGYSPRERLLVLLECKFVQDSTEPRMYRDDIVAFATGKRSYVERFRAKYAWVRDNWRQVCEALESVSGVKRSIEPTRLAGGIITFFPTIAARFIDDIPCVSLPELMLDYEARGEWPYERGSLLL